MVRKFFGMLSFVLFALAVVGCGGSSTSSVQDECTENPSAPACQEIDEDATQVVE